MTRDLQLYWDPRLTSPDLRQTRVMIQPRIAGMRSSWIQTLEKLKV